MSDMPKNFTWRDENGAKLECTEKLRLLQENESELTQMTQDIFEDGIAMGVSKENMNEAMNKLLLRLAASFSLLSLFVSGYARAEDVPPTTVTTGQAPVETTINTPATPPAPTTPTLPMRATPETPPTLIPAPVLYPANSWEGRSVGVIRILDRVTSETKELEIPVGTTITFHRLTLHLYACNQKPLGLPADAAIRLGLSEIPLKVEDSTEAPLQRQFEGWFLAAEPAANIYPSPLYNIQAIRCTGDPTPPTLKPLPAPQQATTAPAALPLPEVAPTASISDTPSVQVPLTPGTPAPGVLTAPPGVVPVPAESSATTPALPFATTPAEEKAQKRKHKHHRHGKDENAPSSGNSPS